MPAVLRRRHAARRRGRARPVPRGAAAREGGRARGRQPRARSRAREAWRKLGVKGGSIAGEAPGPDDPPGLIPRLTIPMVARIQGFPDDWRFSGRKTAAYRQVGNAFPPPVARAFGEAIRAAL